MPASDGEDRGRILLVDDDLDIVSLLSVVFRDAGFAVDVAFDGETALRKAGQSGYDLILLDREMPKLSGLEVLLRLRLAGLLDATPMVILSSLRSSEERIEGLEAGANDYITKPFDPREVVLRVGRLVEEGRRSRRATTAPDGPGLHDAEGALGTLSVADLVQLFGMTRQGGELALEPTDGRPASLRFAEGEIIDVRVGGAPARHPDEEAIRLLQLTRGRYRCHFGASEHVRRVAQPTMALLLEASRRADEGEDPPGARSPEPQRPDDEEAIVPPGESIL